ncbi:MAG TPA: hypothetical protein VGM02_08365 [Acidobacteriaceae bacterium]
MPTAPRRAAASLLFLALPLLMAGCSINVDKGKNGEDKRVKIDTPLGNIHVNADKPADNFGIALYPGAIAEPDHDGDKDADVQLGFGEWKMRVQVAHYRSSDDRDKVLAYYRKSLSRYGDVIECRDNQPIGSPERTSEGLTCSENDRKNSDQHVKMDTGDHGLTLRAGSKRHQHIVAFDKDDADSASGPTKFTLIALDLPAETWKKDRQTD